MSVHSLSEQIWSRYGGADVWLLCSRFRLFISLAFSCGCRGLFTSCINRKVKCRFLFCPQRKVCIQHVVPVHISYLVQSRLQRITSPLSKYWSDFRENIVCESYISFKIEFREFLIDLVHLTFYWTNGIFDILPFFATLNERLRDVLSQPSLTFCINFYALIEYEL